jgi:transcriptional regulator with XRE-family HTH domain
MMPGLSADAFGPSIRAARKAAGLSMPALAERSGVSASAVWKAEKGRHSPVLATAVALCTALGLSLDAACSPKAGRGKR